MSFRFNNTGCLCLLLAGVAAGCMTHRPGPDPLPAVTPSSFREAPAETPSGDLPAPWWTSLNDPVLGGLIDVALAGNLNLDRFVARVRQAHARWQKAGGELLPTLDGTGEVNARTRSKGKPSQTTALGVMWNWEIDVWGRLTSVRDAESQDMIAARWDLEAARLFLSAAVAQTYFEILEQSLQLNLLRRQNSVNATLLDLTRLRFGQGQVSIVDVYQQRAQVAATDSRVPEIESRLEQLEYALDDLLGQGGGTRQRRIAPLLPVLNNPLSPGVPSDLLIHRPDLVAVQNRMRAIDHRIGEALADRLPRFRIGGLLQGEGSPSIDGLLASAVADFVGPIIDGGTRRAEVNLRRAQLDELLAEYSQSYLTAVREVETALLQERKSVERGKRLHEELDIANKLLTETRNRYSQGVLTEYLPVLDAVSRVQILEREVITNERERIGFRVALHRAIGGPMPANEEERK